MNFKRIKLTAIIGISILPFQVSAKNAVIVQDSINFSIENGQAIVVGVEYGLKYALIPDSVTYNWKKYPVTKIGNEAFNGYKMGNDSLRAVQLPKTLVSIGNNAFVNCKRLKEMIVPSSVKEICASAFYGCDSIKKMSLPEGLEYIGEEAFYDCSQIEDMEIPSTVKVLMPMAFCGCSSWKHAEVPKAITLLPRGVFSSCGFEEFTVPEWVNTIEDVAFAECKDLKYIYLPKTLEYIGGDCFVGCRSLLECDIPKSNMIYFPEFTGCTSLKKVTLPDNIETLKGFSFQSCSSLEEINIPSSLRYIEDNAFYGCHSLKEINLPAEILDISDFGTFNECYSLEAIHVGKGNPNYWDVGGVLYDMDRDKERLMFYPAGKKDSIYVVPSTVDEISDNAFYSVRNLKTVVMPDSIYTMGDYAYANSSIEKIYFKGVYCWGLHAFDGCKSLTDIYMLSPYTDGCDDETFGNLMNTATLHVPASALDYYKTTYPFSEFKNIVPDSPEDFEVVTKIKNGEIDKLDQPRYYNLNGCRILKPGKGIIIEVKGNKIKKIVR